LRPRYPTVAAERAPAEALVANAATLIAPHLAAIEQSRLVTRARPAELEAPDGSIAGEDSRP
jgi:hypothetical protein